MRTPTPTLIAALRVLSRDIVCEDGVATAAIAEAADRLEELRMTVEDARSAIVSLRAEVRTQRQEIAALREERAALVAADRPQVDTLP